MSREGWQPSFSNQLVWIPDSKTPNGVAEVPLTDLAVEALPNQMEIAGDRIAGSPRTQPVTIAW
jgi:hypothetical protein